MSNAQWFDMPRSYNGGGATHQPSGLELSPDRTQAVAYGGDDDEVSIPDFVTSLTDGLFAGATALKQVKLPTGLKNLPARLFEGCTSLERVRLPPKVNQVGAACFADCTSLKDAPLAPGMSEIASDMFRGCTGITSFAAPDGLEAIRRGAFAGCTALETVIISDTVDTIEEGAFDGCTALKHIRISDDNPVYYMEEDGTLRNKSDGEVAVAPALWSSQGAVASSGQSAAATGAVGLLQCEEEIDLTPDDDEEDSDESMEEMDNNFIGEEEEIEIASPATGISDDGDSDVHVKPSDSEATTSDNTEEKGGKEDMASIEEILSQNIFNRPSNEGDEPPEIRFASSAEEAEQSAARLEAEMTHHAAPAASAPQPTPAAEVAPAPQSEAPAAPAPQSEAPATPATPITADAGELNRIAMESDILKQNVGATDASDTPLKADTSEVNRIAMESDILSQNVKGANEVGAGMEELILLSKESEILRDNTKVANHITLTPTEKAAKVEGEEIPVHEEESPIASAAPAHEPEEEKPDPILGRIKGAAQKYERIETSGTQLPGLFVFAEKLAPSDDGEDKFSAHLVRAARNLAAKHSLKYIHLFYGLPFDHIEFMQLFGQFILGKDSIYACDTKSTHGLSPLARAFAESANIKLDKESMADQMMRAKEKTGRSFRIILQDDYSK